MTYDATIEEPRGDYVKLEEGFDGRAQEEASSSSGCGGGGDGGWCWSLWWWLKLILVVTFLGVLAAVIFKWVGPFFMDKEIIPIIHWEMETFSTQVLALIVFGSVALFPILLLPSTPSMWVAGMTFGYGYGFLLTIGAVAIGVSLPYFIGFLFHHKIQMWLERYPKKASIIRLAGEGNWFNQFRAVALIRISPFPYVIYNYTAVATNITYGPYFLGSLAGMVPEVFVALYTGILIKTLADASHDQHSLSASQIIFNTVGFCITLATTVIITLYAKKRLKELQREDHLLLQ
ncbi:SNARE associated Golgi protein family [Forsythia ovata]|uniref:SNARE associated Golgi protein family n=1 Tax=Forsythia ovata TaxID=205694 RepID=A0ABD1WQ85_9LAMI